MNKGYYDGVCERLFGPFAGLVRASSDDRRSRFLVCGRPDRDPSVGGHKVPVLGFGASWREALVCAVRSDHGKAAREEQKSALKMIKAAMAAETPQAFADSVAEQVVAELAASGANEEEIQAVREKFTKAKEHIK